MTPQLRFGKQTLTISFKPDYSFGIAKGLAMLKKYYEIGLYDAAAHKNATCYITFSKN